MHIHILGICGTFMGGIALLAKQLGYSVSGSDASVYPPMSKQLEDQGITLFDGYDAQYLHPAPDIVVIGNALSRGNPAVEHVLQHGLRYTSGAQWLAEHFLQDRWVLAVAGTHGKTTTSSLLAWILEDAKLNPGFLIGGVPNNFGISARAGSDPFFVIEADEYDTAFFDKRSKFVHYHPRTLVMNNLEFDHADIFDDIADIQRQFHHLVRTVPGNGLIIYNAADKNLREVIDMGCWTPLEQFAASMQQGWSLAADGDDAGGFEVLLDGQGVGSTGLSLPGIHNQLNAVAAIVAARHAGVPLEVSLHALQRFQGIQRRMQLCGEVNGVRVYDDFAHHPTAIALTLQGLRQYVGDAGIIAVLEPRSNTMRMGIHQQQLPASLKLANEVFVYQSAAIEWDMQDMIQKIGAHARSYTDMSEMVTAICAQAAPGKHILVMSNGDFGGVHQKILDALA